MPTEQEQIQLRKKDLEHRLYALRQRYNNQIRNTGYARVFGMLFIFAVVPFAYISFKLINLPFGFLFIGIGLLLYSVVYPIRELEIEVRDAENELDLLTIKKDSLEQRAEKLFKLHQFELKKYYDQTLIHTRWIFLAGIICIIFGFILIMVTIFLVFNSSTPQLSDKIILAAQGAVGGLLTNFIAVIYLKMYSKTVKSLTEFHNRLVLTHQLHFGNFLSAKITNKELREKTLAEIALNTGKSSPKE